MIIKAPTDRRLLRTLACVSSLALLAAACGDDDDGGTEAGGDGGGGESAADCELHDAAEDPALADYQENGITIGIANERPYGYEEDGEATGEAPELAEAILCQLGIEDVNFEVQEFGALVSGLNADRLDVTAAGMFITPERALEALFADPDYCAKNAFAVEEGNPNDITDFESIADSDATLGVLDGAVELGYAEDLGVPSDQIEPFQETVDMFDALEAGRVQAVALTEPTIVAQTDAMEGFEATEGFYPVVDGEEQFGCGGFAFRYDDLEVRNLFTQVLNEMQDNDEVLPIVEEFGFDEETMETAADITAAELAGGAYDDLDLGDAGGGAGEEGGTEGEG